MNRGLRFLGVVLGVSLAYQAGCGGTSTPTPLVEVPPGQVELQEVGEMYRIFIDDNKRPARASKDLLKYAAAFTFGSMALQEKEVVVFWGASLQPDSTTVLAYQKAVPESGGVVLLQDGQTVKSMTAQEFQSAPKAGSVR
ncbi:hypothetical protein [Singulisphaera acidiphila]|uniref:Lipoprotein n=1 Tax=Singulisphaera acidiphila (strain ATCC BAA-1392 / DSM 18658 / VKM B-2454 / MOB10) TaxID=886293 RepID=L0DHI1_SINAD|nr:hypothetical protein [Singulisphaera acidiphila]AGA28717.1 hypothetical protein Sinac_4535 [Singulisphaera acidiphila DSM 18658]